MVYDIIVIGGGIIGLATAKKILEDSPNYKVLILEKESDIASHQTSHNSGVIHSGLYYKPGSLKAKNCIDGYNYLLNFCRSNNISHEITGKIVVATSPSQIPQLNLLYDRGIKNGLSGIKKLSKSELLEYEPHVNGVNGLYVPQTGIIDYLEVSKAYRKIILEKGGTFHFNSKVENIIKNENFVLIVTNSAEFRSKLIINCAGLYSDRISKLNNHGVENVRIIPFRGEYFKIKKEKEYLVKNLIYPVPDPNFPFLGVHFTRMINGGIEAGPNAVLAFKKEGYNKWDFNLKEFAHTLLWPGFQKVAKKYWKTGFEEYYRCFSKAAFTKALQQLIPEIRECDLVEGGSGVRAQACDINGSLLDDFCILQNQYSIDVVNAPSPAATSSLAIANRISDLVKMQ